MVKLIFSTMRKIRYNLNRHKWKSLKWGKLGTFSIGESFKINGSEYIYIGDGFSGGKFLILQAWSEYEGVHYSPEIIIGSNVSMMENCQISCCNKVVIGDGCLFGANVFITDNFHGNNSKEQLDIPPKVRPLDVRDPVIVGRNVWVGRNVCVMPGVSIGDGAVIGANAVVTHDIPSGCIAVGSPARVIKNIVEE